ncbi:MAG: hypothetical protein HQL99_10575 [Magnetococcales bacterium]|nr:hypothetical protein [Magnetococcales bacterium]
MMKPSVPLISLLSLYALCTTHPAGFFLLILILTLYATRDHLNQHKLHDKNFFGSTHPHLKTHDHAWIWYQLLLVSGYGYVLACRLPSAIGIALLVATLTLTLRTRLSDPFSQRRFLYYGSIAIGLGYSVITLLAGRIPTSTALWTLLGGWMGQPVTTCGLVQIFDAFNTLTDAMIRLLPFPFDLLLTPLNLNLLFGPLTTGSVLGILKAEDQIRNWRQRVN